MFPQSTYRRLLKLAFQPNSVWEGDRLSLNFKDPGGTIEDLEESRDCVLWVDGVNGVVRAMDMVSATTGQEAIVRTLLQAMEQPLDTPNQISRPARPKKVVVRSREFQFFLRGVLQDLDITVEYQPELPLIDEFFSGLERMMRNRIPTVPPQYAETVDNIAQRIWELAPWKSLSDHHILRISLPDLDEKPKLYVSVLGKLGMEFGVLLYRSLESLKVFRESVINATHPEETFFRQDCFYITFNRPDDLEDDQFSPPISLDWEDIALDIGSIHPLEGMQRHLGEEEAQIVILALEGFLKFCQKHRKALKKEPFPSLLNRFKLSVPWLEGSSVSVEVCTEPEIAQEIWDLTLDEDDEDWDEDWEESDFMLNPAIISKIPKNIQLNPIGNDLIPQGAILSLGNIPWDFYEILERRDRTQAQWLVEHREGDGLPILSIQTTRPKAKALAEHIKAAGGLAGIYFTMSTDPTRQYPVELALLKFGNGHLELFNVYDPEDPVHQKAKKKWDRRITETRKMCGLILAQGVTGKRRGEATLEDITILMEAPYLELESMVTPF